MKKEELLKLSKEELIEKIEKLENTKNLFFEESQKVKEQFNRYKEAVKSVVLLID